MEQLDIAPSGWLVNPRRHRLVRRINAWIASPGYVLLIAVLTMLSGVFSMELPVYTVFALFALYICILGDDLLGIMPMAICGYISPSRGNNPGVAETSVFYPQNGGIYILFLLVLIFSTVLLRLIFDKQIGGKAFLRAQRKLLPGLLVLGTAYMLSGVGSGHYFDKGMLNFLFSLIQVISVCLLYWLFAGAVRWQRTPGNYFAWAGFGYGMVILAEVISVYLTVDILKDGVLQISLISSGWGNANNVGAMLAMAIPFAFYLSGTGKSGWIYNICASLMLLGVIFTSSRTAILGAGFCYGCGFLLGVSRAKKTGDRANLVVFMLTVLAALVAVALAWETLMKLFKIMLDKGLDSSRRDVAYFAGIRQWLKYPVFGGTFYPIEFEPETWNKLEAFTSFFPPRWHNTLVQLGACCGTVGLAAYSYHRIQTIRLFWAKRQENMTYLAISLLSLLLMSLLDCHFFNIGPTLFYSVALAFAEKCPVKET